MCTPESYTYDPWGNILTLGANTTTQPNYVGCTQESGFNYNGLIAANNRIAASGFSYDAAGNMTASPGFTYVYDAENHLTTTAGVTYAYDGDGKRLTKSNGTMYWYGASSDPRMETDLSNNLKLHYIFFNGQRVASQNVVNQVNWYFADHLGTARLVFGVNGNDLSDFYPYGGERVHSASVGNHYKFTGKERDSETGLDNFGARFNSSTIGRFISADPLKASGSPRNPQSWNRYSYVLNSPLALVDRDGQCSAPAVGKGQVGVCVDLYIAAPRINGLGRGDDRGPAPKDPSATYRTEVQMVLDPAKGTAAVVKNDAGTSTAKIIGVPDSPLELDISHKGTSSTTVSPVTKDDNGDMHFTMSNVGLNGLSSLPGAPKDTIKTDVNFDFTPDGKVGLDSGGMRTAFPSLEIYSYDSKGNATTILQVPETKPEDLCCKNQTIPRVPPQ